MNPWLYSFEEKKTLKNISEICSVIHSLYIDHNHKFGISMIALTMFCLASAIQNLYERNNLQLNNIQLHC